MPFDGGATLGWPGARCPPDPDPGPGHVDVVAHDLTATIDATSETVASSTLEGRVPIVIPGEDSLFSPSVPGFHDAGRARWR